MRKLFLAGILFLNVFFVQGFSLFTQASTATIIILNRKNQATIQITDGDTIRLQIELAQPVEVQQNIAFFLENTTNAFASCVILSGNKSCTTDPFPALGWYWNPEGNIQNVRIIEASSTRERIQSAAWKSQPIKIAPRPVVMVHGFVSNWQTWNSYLQRGGFLDSLGIKGYAVGDGQVPGTMNTGVITNPTGRTNTIAQNAEILGQYISNVKKQTGAEMVDLLVHSMGGMISRHYIDRLMQERDVAQLIMLGSPMGGSNCSVLPASLGFFLPGSIEIRESYMRGVFNQQITHRKGIEFYDLGGTAITESFKSPCTDIPNDTVVSVESVNSISLQSSTLDDVHTDLTRSNKAFTDFVKPLLQKPAGSFQSDPDPAPMSPADSPLEFTRVYTGHVQAGGATEIAINIEPNITVASFALYDPSRSVTTIVRGASGNIIQLDPQANGFVRVDDPSSLFYLGYGFQSPRPGLWRVTIQASESTPANGTDFAISVYFVGGAKLETASSTLVPQLNERVSLSAKVSLNGQALQITQAQAVIRKPNGGTERLDFPAGQTTSVSWVPRETGTHAVDIVVTALAPDGSSIERTSFLAIEVQPSFSRLQISFNLALLLGFVLLILLGILFGVIRLFRRARR